MRAELASYQRLLDHLQRLTQDAEKPEVRSKIIQKLIHKIEVKAEGFRLQYFVSQDHLQREFAMKACFLLFYVQKSTKRAQSTIFRLSRVDPTGWLNFL